MPLLKPCIICSVLSPQTRCPTHRIKDTRNRGRRGRDAAWDALSRQARSIQQWCSDCGTSLDLTTDHSREAWEAKAQGKPITLDLVDVVCRSCNAKRGAAR